MDHHTERRESEASPPSSTSRILLADDDTVRIFDLNDTDWSARIDKAAAHLGRIADVTFGHTSDEVLVFSDFGIKVTIWSIVTRRGVEIRDPKYANQCYSFRPRTGHLAVLTRPVAQDILMLLNPGDHSLAHSVELPTVDAQEVSWSPNGQWIVIRDVASAGRKLYFYTADGHLFKTYTRDEEGSDVGLGIKCIQWSRTDGKLAIGDYNDEVTILSETKVKGPVYAQGQGALTNLQFSPLMNLKHSSTIEIPIDPIWQEQLDAEGKRSYVVAPQPASASTSASTAKSYQTPAYGISQVIFNNNGSLLATKSDSIPTTVWIWSMSTGAPVAVLIHHSPVKHLAWHPTEPELLLIRSAIPEPSIHVWKSDWETPKIFSLPLARASGRLEAQWLRSSSEAHFDILLSSTQSYTTARITIDGEVIPEERKAQTELQTEGVGAEVMFDEGHSFDLSPIKIAHDETLEVPEGIDEGNISSGSGLGMDNDMVDDTFHYRRHVRAAG